MHTRLKSEYQDAGLAADDWQAMSLQFSGAVDGILARRIAVIDTAIRVMTEGEPAVGDGDPEVRATNPLPTPRKRPWWKFW